MIIKGNVQTMKGPVSIASLMEGDMVITAKRIPSKVVRVTKKKIKTVQAKYVPCRERRDGDSYGLRHEGSESGYGHDA